jgi:uncharacterized protein (DUF302 family)
MKTNNEDRSSMKEPLADRERELPLNYERAVEQATAALKEQAFGVLTTIDVRQTLKQTPACDAPSPRRGRGAFVIR